VSTDTFQPPTGSEPGAVAASAGPGAGGPSPTERPEVQVGAAFAGGFLVALILKRFGN
jgi:hypothetical protein